ncbi:MAG: UDP-3-O-(3-hydroxymyristoyl)glucosamine N-acyltransferase [Alphaproteobacteria bacterium]
MADPRFFERHGPFTAGQLAEIAGAELFGATVDPDLRFDDVAPLTEAQAAHLSFLDNPKYLPDFKASKAGLVLCKPDMVDKAPEGMALLVSEAPYRGYALCAQAFYPVPRPQSFVSTGAHVHDTAELAPGCEIAAGAVIEAGAKLGASVRVAANAVIGPNVEIGDGSEIGACASLSHCVIGERVRIYPGVRIGQDGFGFAFDPRGHVRVPQLGRVIVEDDVEIGANVTIDRGAGPDTVIGAGTMIDNLVQIGHNVKIGRGCVLIAQSGVAGSAEMQDFSVLAAQSGIAGHITIGMGARIGGQSGVMRDVPAGQDMIGSPAMPSREYWRYQTTLKKLVKRARTRTSKDKESA